ncbi:hypothetical protein U1Q18_011328 [Sarracenia purpurea var. burkii]
MEEKVQITLKLIEEDGDSFAKRAEMYYKKRPELINFVEESYRAYRALAERYDHISKELQNANTTIASVFPEQVQFAMEDEEDYGSSPKVQENPLQTSTNNIPKVPKFPSRDLKGLFTSASKKLQARKTSKAFDITNKSAAPKSGLSKSEALEEIDKHQKEILALQTVKEFIRSSYESGLAKYWEIEKQITELQERVNGLRDEFGIGKVIEDDDARTLMAEAALKSCEEALDQLKERQEKSTLDARAEFKRVEDAREKLKSLKHKFLPDQLAEEEEKPNEYDESEKAVENAKGLNPEVEKPNEKDESTKEGKKSQVLNPEADFLMLERQEMDVLRDKIKEHFEVVSKESLTVSELAEKIDELVSKVISLETSVSSQTALIDRLKTETDDLQAQILTLEDDKATLIDGTNNLTNRLREMEEKLNKLQELNQDVEKQNDDLQMNFTEARCSLDHLSKKLPTVKPDEQLKGMESLKGEVFRVEVKKPEVLERKEDMPNTSDGSISTAELKLAMGDEKNNTQGQNNYEKVSQVQSNNNDPDTISEKQEDQESQENVHKHGETVIADNVVNSERQELAKESDDEPNWQQMLLNGLEDREKILLTEYTTILRSYKDVKKKLSDVEKSNKDSLFETTVQLRELRNAIAKRDEEIRSLRQKLNLPLDSVVENEDLKELGSISILLDGRNGKSEATEDSKVNGVLEVTMSKKDEEDVKLIFIDQPQSISPIEEKLRISIDALLDKNLDFWLRFSTSFHQIQKFKTRFQDLQAEISKLKEKEKSNQEGSVKNDIKSDLRPIYKHLREIQTELTLWIEQSTLLKDELQHRFSSLGSIQEEIKEALKAGAEEEEMKFTSHEAAKFQGEVLNMQQENTKVRDELQAGLDHINALQHEIEKTLEKLDEEFGNQSQLRHSTSRSRVPLRSFIFGTKPKKRTSIFSSIHHRK